MKHLSFSLRELMLFIAIVSLSAAWWTERARLKACNVKLEDLSHSWDLITMYANEQTRSDILKILSKHRPNYNNDEAFQDAILHQRAR